MLPFPSLFLPFLLSKFMLVYMCMLLYDGVLYLRRLFAILCIYVMLCFAMYAMLCYVCAYRKCTTTHACLLACYATLYAYVEYAYVLCKLAYRLLCLCSGAYAYL